MRHKAPLHGYEEEASDSEDESISFLSGGGGGGSSSSGGGSDYNQHPIRYGYSIVPLDERKEKKNVRSVGGAVKDRKKKKDYSDSDDDDDDDNDTDDGDEVYVPKETAAPLVRSKMTKRKAQKAIKGKKTRSSYYGGDSIECNVVFVVDYDMTLVDRNARPFPGVKEFLRGLYDFNGGRSTLVLFSHATSGHIEHGLNTYFAGEVNYFTKIITDHSMVKNKPVTRVRRSLSDIRHLCGPFCIIDDVRANLDDDQYDITVDVSRHFIRDRTAASRVVGVDYEAILCLLREGVEQWLATKTGHSSNHNNNSSYRRHWNISIAEK
jgi:hypothetical protein